MDKTPRAEGFRGQVMHVVPRPLLERERRHLLARALCVTDIGWFPLARGHYRERRQGAEQHILILCGEGAGWYEVAGRRGLLRARQALLIPQGAPHAYGASARQPWSIHWVHFTGEDAAYYLRLLPEAGPVVPVAGAPAAEMARIFRDCYAAIGAGPESRTLAYLSHALRHLLGLLFFRNRSYSPAARAGPRTDFEGVIDFLLENLDRPLRLADMARRAGQSVPHFAARFRMQTGLPPVEYFTHLRIQQACRLLDSTRLPVAAVGTRVGYEDPYHFSRVFRRVMGFPPRRYLQLHRG